MTDPFWFDDISILFDKDRLVEFFPSKFMSYEEKLNAIFRLCIYFTVLMILVNSGSKKPDIQKYLLFLIGAAILTIFFYKYRPEKKMKEGLENMLQTETSKNTQPENECTRPTLDNPFMNFTMGDFMNIQDGKIVDKAAACDNSSPDVKEEVDKYFENNLYRDVDDVFGKMNSQRQFYTMPWTSPLPDPDGNFKNWLYKSPLTCKEDSDYCLRYEDIRQKTPVFVNPNENPVKNS
jgi:hypothetical protein